MTTPSPIRATIFTAASLLCVPAQAELELIAAQIFYKNLSEDPRQGFVIYDSETDYYQIPVEFVPEYIEVESQRVDQFGVDVATQSSLREVIYEPQIGAVTVYVKANSLPLTRVDTRIESETPLDLDEFFAIKGSVSGFISKRENEQRNFTGVLNTGIGVPHLGNLKTGARASDDGTKTKYTRLATSLQKDFVASTTSLELGEMIRAPQNNGNATLFRGLSVFSNYGLQPGRNFDPSFDYLLELDSASKVRVLQNNTELFTTSTEEATRLQLQGLRSSTNGNIIIAVEDINGEQRLIEVPFLVSNTQLNEGQVLYNISLGERVNSDLEGTGLLTGIGRLGFGLPHQTTIEVFAQGSEEMEFRESIIQGFSVNQLSTLGAIDLMLARSQVEEHEGRSVIASYRRQFAAKSNPINVGVSYQERKDFFTGTRFDTNQSTRVFINTRFNRSYIGASHLFSDEGNSVSTINYGYVTQSGIGLSASAVSDGNKGHAGQIAITIPLGRSVSLGTSGRYDSTETKLATTSISGYSENLNTAINASAIYRENGRQTSENADGQYEQMYFGTLNHSSDYFGVGYTISRANERNLHQGNLSTGFAYVPGAGFDVDRQYRDTSAIGVILTDTPDTTLRTQGGKFTTGSDGAAIFPIEPNRNQAVSLNPEKGTPSAQGFLEPINVRAKPGYASIRSVAIPSTPAIIEISAESLSVNGQQAQLTGMGFFSDNLVSGKNTLLIDGRAVEIRYQNQTGTIVPHILDGNKLIQKPNAE